MRSSPHRWLAAVVTAATALALFAGPAVAHLAIRVDIRAPQGGQRVGPNTDVVLRAQPMLAGVAHTAVTAYLDGHPINPANGAAASRAMPVDMTLLAQRRIPLRRLGVGTHTVTISYRPDVDEPVFRSSVSFVVVRNGFPRWALALVVLGAATVMALVAVRLRRRSRRAEERATA